MGLGRKTIAVKTHLQWTGLHTHADPRRLSGTLGAHFANGLHINILTAHPAYMNGLDLWVLDDRVRVIKWG